MKGASFLALGLLCLCGRAQAQDAAAIAACEGGPQPALAYQIALTRAIVASHVRDPNNTRLSEVMMRCASEGFEVHDICGTAAHMNAVGYVDAATRFYTQVRQSPDDRFSPPFALGAKAEAICRTKAMP